MVSRPIDEVVNAHAAELLAIPGVTVVYVGAGDDGTPAIVVGVVARGDAPAARIPDTLEGYPVVIQETGAIGPR